MPWFNPGPSSREGDGFDYIHSGWSSLTTKLSTNSLVSHTPTGSSAFNELSIGGHDSAYLTGLYQICVLLQLAVYGFLCYRVSIAWHGGLASYVCTTLSSPLLSLMVILVSFVDKGRRVAISFFFR